MIMIVCMVLMSAVSHSIPIYEFSRDSDISDWRVVNDGVMGGVSTSSMTLSPDGHGLFEGRVSLENNGGFCSIRYPFERMCTQGHAKIILRVKGDGKRYQFRIKNRRTDRHSYITYFMTSGEWEEIEIDLYSMYPSFRGRVLDLPDFDHDHIEEVGVLIANEKAEKFELLIDRITLR